jgi:hypothetical protein
MGRECRPIRDRALIKSIAVKSKSQPKIDWDTVELVGDLLPVSSSQPTKFDPVDQPLRAPRHLKTKQILSGAAAKARARGATHTHTQLREIVPEGLETLIYGVWLMTAAFESDRDASRGVEIAALAISGTSKLFAVR